LPEGFLIAGADQAETVTLFRAVDKSETAASALA